MKLYITGIAGLLGSNIVKELYTKCEITGVDIYGVEIPNVKYSTFSLYEIDKLREHLILEKPDVVIHTAAAINVDACEENPEWAYRLNDETTEVLADLCDLLGIKMVYISSDAVFDGLSEKLYTEEDQVNPLNIYAKSKLAGEEKVLQYEKNLVCRTNIYGLNIQPKMSFGEWVVTSLEDDKTLNMFDDIDFSPILVSDLADIIYMALEKNLCGLYHICSTGCINKYDFGIEFKRVFGIETGVINRTQSETMHFKAKRSKHMGMSNEKIRSTLGIEIRSPKESVKEFKRLWDEKQLDDRKD